MKTKTRKLLSLLLALMMLLSVVPFYASAEAIALTTDNVTVWPTLEGESYYGQAIGNNYTLNGGEVQYNGEVVSGKFELVDSSDYVPVLDTNTGTFLARVVFVPDDETTYTGFEYKRNYNIKWTTPTVTVAPTVDVTVDSGTRLAKVAITGGTLLNPYSGEYFQGEWAWTSKRTQITASGYHEASLINYGYESITMKIFVQLTGDDSAIKLSTVIEELPTVITTPTFGDDWSTVELSGGKAVDDVNGLEVPGKFQINKTGTIKSTGDIKLDVLFTPDDTDKYFSAIATITVTVNKAPIKFLDENGNDVVPEIELGYNNNTLEYNVSEIKRLLAPYANCAEDKFWVSFYDLDNNEMEHSDDYLEIGTTKEYTIKGASYDSNYTPAVLKFKLTVVPRKLSATVTYSGNTIKVKTTKPLTQAIYGTFEYYANGELIGTSAITGTTDSTGLAWKPEKSGSYDITVKYVAAENDKYYWDDTVLEDMEIICAWGVSVEGGSVKVSNGYKEFGSFKYGEDVSVQSDSVASFSHWIVTDVNGNEIDVEGFDKTASGNTFKMPDMSLRFKAVELEIRNITLANAFVKNAVGTADAPAKYRGQSVNIALDTDALSADNFKGWVITDAQGNEFLPEGLTEEDLTKTEITFIMPDFDITVRAKSVAEDCEHLCHSDFFLAKIVWKMLNIIFRLFDVQQYCDCGILHYEAPFFG